MKNSLRLLLAEGSEDVAASVTETLAQGGYDPRCERVNTLQGTETALDREPWDILLLDDRVPGVNVASIRELLNRKGLDLPCVLLSDEDDEGK